jgi:hypothetical protein
MSHRSPSGPHLLSYALGLFLWRTWPAMGTVLQCLLRCCQSHICTAVLWNMVATSQMREFKSKFKLGKIKWKKTCSLVVLAAFPYLLVRTAQRAFPLFIQVYWTTAFSQSISPVPRSHTSPEVRAYFLLAPNSLGCFIYLFIYLFLAILLVGPLMLSLLVLQKNDARKLCNFFGGH